VEPFSIRVAAQRVLAGWNEELFGSGLVVSLRRRAGRLSVRGDALRALGSAEETVTLQRRLYQHDPARHRAGLVKALGEFAYCLTGVREPERALAAATEAIELSQAEGDAILAAEARLSLADVHTGAGRLEDALAPAQLAVEALREAGDRGRGGERRVLLAGALSTLAACLQGLGRAEEALAAITESVREYDAVPLFRRVRNLKALYAQVRYADLLQTAGRNEEALAQADEAEIVTGVVADWYADRGKSLRGWLFTVVARANAQLGRQAEAEAAAAKAVALWRPLADTDPATYLPSLSTAVFQQARALARRGENEAALTLVREALAKGTAIPKALPASYENDRYTLLDLQAKICWELGLREESVAATEAALEALARIPPGIRSAEYPVQRSFGLNDLADRLRETGQTARAVAAAESAVDAARALTGTRAKRLTLSQALSQLGAALWHADRRPESLAALQESVAVWREPNAEGDDANALLLAARLLALAAKLRVLTRSEEAIPLLVEAVDLVRHAPPEDDLAGIQPQQLAGTLIELARAYCACDRDEEALTALDTALAAYRRLSEDDRTQYQAEIAECLGRLAHRQAKRGRITDSVAKLRELHDLAATTGSARAREIATNSFEAARAAAGPDLPREWERVTGERYPTPDS
jgi:tetratricopeptide (TPR) repeat protein